MAQPTVQAAAQVCGIAEDLCSQEACILFDAPIRRLNTSGDKTHSINSNNYSDSSSSNNRGSLLTTALTTLLQKPTLALTQSLFGGNSKSQIAAGSHLEKLHSGLLSSQELKHGKGAVWLSWEDCRCLFQVFCSFEYVDALGKPTSLVDTFVSRLTAGEAVSSASGTTGPGSSSKNVINSMRRRRRSTNVADGSTATTATSASGTSELWRGWSGNQDMEPSDDSESEDSLRAAAWHLISNIFARATSLKISAEAEEVSESEAQAVLTWFPQLEYLEIQSIPCASLRFWSSWLPGRLSCLKIQYAGLDLQKTLDPDGLSGKDTTVLWSRLALLDLSSNPGINLEPLGGPLAQKIGNVSRLSLAQCELDNVPKSLSLLYNLGWLDLRDNGIDDVSDISLRLGSIVRLNLANNNISDVSGLRRLWALEALDMSANKIYHWSAFLSLRNLPLLKELFVLDNPFTRDPSQQQGYRAQIFSAFDHRDVLLELDGSGPSAQERRAMAKIPRVATGHANTAVQRAADVPSARQRRPKVAFIEEAEADDYDDNESHNSSSSVCGDEDADADEDTKSTNSIPQRTASVFEKTPHVLRASELQAVTVAAAHRRSNVGSSILGSPHPRGIPVKQGPALRRRATATTPSGLLISPSRLQKQQTYSVPSSFSTRSGRPAVSNIGMGIVMGMGMEMGVSNADNARIAGVSGLMAGRDPERYRRKVEMMRAEAGSSWLRAFTELQSQSSRASRSALASESPLSANNVSHFESELHAKADLLSLHTLDNSSQVSSPEQSSASDTKLPSFLFPRRRNAGPRKKEIARLPHYSDESIKSACDDQQRHQEKLATAAEAEAEALKISRDNEGSLQLPVDTSDADSGRNRSEQLDQQQDKDRDTTGTTDDEPNQQLSVLQDILQRNRDLCIFDQDVAVLRFQFVPIVETPLVNDKSISSGSRVIRRTECGMRTVVATQSELIEIGISEDGDQKFCSTTPLSAVVRVKSLGKDKSGSFLAEIKGDRFDSPVWIHMAYSSKIMAVLESAAQENAGLSAGLEARVYKQAECLRCGWKGYTDREHEVFEILLADGCDKTQEFTVLEPGPTEIKCARCGRRYMREFYAGEKTDELDSTSMSASALVSADTANIGTSSWRQALKARRTKGTDGRKTRLSLESSERQAEHVQRACTAMAADMACMADVAVPGCLAFGEATNAVRLFLELSVFTADAERLMRWVPAGLIRQSQPILPTIIAAAPAEKPVASSKWGLSSLLGGSSVQQKQHQQKQQQQHETKQSSPLLSAGLQKICTDTSSDWRVSAELKPALCEQAVFLALSSHAIYVFSPTWGALEATSMTPSMRAEIELQPERYLALVFSLPLTGLGRIDIGPNRQYLALHSSLLSSLKEPTPHWNAAALETLLSPSLNPAYPCSGSSDAARADFVSSKHQQRNPALAGGKGASSCVLMIRDRLACSDLLDALVEIGYETRVLDSGAGAGSGRLRAINHDIEWAMHHLVQQVFLRPTTFANIDDNNDNDNDNDNENGNSNSNGNSSGSGHVGEATRSSSVEQDRKRALSALRCELLRSPSSCQPGAMVDSASGDNVIIDKVTYEFMKLYFCVGLASRSGIEPLTLVGSPHFVYIVRERVDIWPPPVPDMRLLYRRWQRIAPPTIVTSDPDNYDPETLTQELARRSNATSVASRSSVASRKSEDGQSVGDTALEEEGSNAADSSLLSQLVSSTICQYDRVRHARPIADLRRIVLVPTAVAAVPCPENRKSEELLSKSESSDNEEVLGCTGTSWHAMLRVEFSTSEKIDSQDRAVDNVVSEADWHGWNVWFATTTSARECAEALQQLAVSVGTLDVEFIEA
ncbi:hypothetical protein LPJ64_002084 [Coemansia asiatica]|uniref:Uncharacterized protein n=1 Tax=Coemansia asiatica TaxID=1052880 RepID=A0A9W7XNT3_9FUNG|nr:hypothetical protein LPJ64_002084 [Coemansia asiatica]